jgi:hypothetical protein
VYPSVDCYQTFYRPLLSDKNGKDTRTMSEDNVIVLKKPESIIVDQITDCQRTIQSGIGSVPVHAPRVRDRHPHAPQRICFSSAILPPYLRRTKSIEELIPLLYLRAFQQAIFQKPYPHWSEKMLLGYRLQQSAV